MENVVGRETDVGNMFAGRETRISELLRCATRTRKVRVGIAQLCIISPSSRRESSSLTTPHLLITLGNQPHTTITMSSNPENNTSGPEDNSEFPSPLPSNYANGQVTDDAEHQQPPAANRSRVSAEARELLNTTDADFYDADNPDVWWPHKKRTTTACKKWLYKVYQTQ